MRLVRKVQGFSAPLVGSEFLKKLVNRAGFSKRPRFQKQNVAVYNGQTTHVPVPLVLQMIVQLVVVPISSFQVQMIEQLVIVPMFFFRGGRQRCFRSDLDFLRKPKVAVYNGADGACFRAARAAHDGTVDGCANVFFSSAVDSVVGGCAKFCPFQDRVQRWAAEQLSACQISRISPEQCFVLSKTSTIPWSVGVVVTVFREQI